MHFFEQRDGVGNVGKVVEIPAGIVDRNLLFTFYSTAFHFPDWFGYNWDAFLDCLRDVRDSFSQITIQHSDIPFLSSPKDKEAYLCILLLTCTLHKDNVIVKFPSELLDEIDEVILAHWRGECCDIMTKEDVLTIVTRIVSHQESKE